jgi:hypothetical protein
MADIMSILSASAKSSGLAVPSRTSYVAVDPKTYQGTWTGKYADNKSFKITVSNVSGFRAKVQYQSAGTVKYQDVLIKDGSFRVGDTKFTLAKAGTATKAATAQIRNVITDPATGSTYLDTAFATQSR